MVCLGFVVFFFLLYRVFVATCGLSQVVARRGLPSVELLTSVASLAVQNMGVGCRLQWLWHITQAWLLLNMWDLPGSEIKPVSPALAGRFLTTGPPGSPNAWVLFVGLFYQILRYLWYKIFCRLQLF